MLEAQDELVHLQLGDRTFHQLAIRVIQLIAVALKEPMRPCRSLMG